MSVAVPKSVSHWSLTTLREKLVKIGAKVTRHSKYVFFQLAEVAVPRHLFAAILERIRRLAMQPAVCPITTRFAIFDAAIRRLLPRHFCTLCSLPGRWAF